MPACFRRHALTDHQWREMSQLLPTRDGPGRPAKDHRLVLDGILWVLRTGSPWRDLPEFFGPWQSVYSRFRRWTRAGVWSSIHDKLLANQQRSGRIDWQLFMIDGTVIRAHKAAAGGEKKALPDEPPDHALGMSRGGIGTKVHVVCDGAGLPIALDVTAGQAHEATRCIPLLARISVPSGGRPKQHPAALAGDKAYSMPAIRVWLKARRIDDVIPTRKDQPRRPNFDKAAYRRRNMVERLIAWLKESRRLATRYEKLAVHFLGMLTLGMVLRHLG